VQRGEGNQARCGCGETNRHPIYADGETAKQLDTYRARVPTRAADPDSGRMLGRGFLAHDRSLSGRAVPVAVTTANIHYTRVPP